MTAIVNLQGTHYFNAKLGFIINIITIQTIHGVFRVGTIGTILYVTCVKEHVCVMTIIEVIPHRSDTLGLKGIFCKRARLQLLQTPFCYLNRSM